MAAQSEKAGSAVPGISPRTVPARATTLYNGACPVCGPEIHRYQRIDASTNGDLGWRDISQEPGILAEWGLDPEDVKERLHVIDEAGQIHIGVDAFAVIWAELPGHRWLSRMARAPVVGWVARIVYDRLLAPALYRWNRYRDGGGDPAGPMGDGRG